MPKYKVGDVAALFPTPKAAKTETGIKLQTLFNDFYVKSKPNAHQNSTPIPDKLVENSPQVEEPVQRKSKKRKLSHLETSVTDLKNRNLHKKTKWKSEENTLPPTDNIVSIKPRKTGALSADEVYFPRRKQGIKPNVREKAEDLDMVQTEETDHVVKGKKSVGKFGKPYNFSNAESMYSPSNLDKIFQKKNVSENFKNDLNQFNVHPENNKLKINPKKRKVCSSLSPQKSANEDNKDKNAKSDELNALGNAVKVKKHSKKERKLSMKKEKADGNFINISSMKQSQLNVSSIAFSQNNALEKSPEIKSLKKRKRQNVAKDLLQGQVENIETYLKSAKKIKKSQTSLDFSNNRKDPDDQMLSEQSVEGNLVRKRNKIKKKFKPTPENSFNAGKDKIFNNESNNSKHAEKSMYPPKEENKDYIKLPKSKSEETEERLSRMLYVGNLPTGVIRKAVRNLFIPFGRIETIWLRGAIPSAKKQGMPRKIVERTGNYNANLHSVRGYVVFKRKEEALEALTLNGTLFENRHILVDKATSSGDKKIYDGKRSVFIGNLPFDVDDEVIWSAFSQCGLIDGVRVVRDHATGAGKGFGYVMFHNAESKDRALTLENVEIGGRELRIKSIEGVNKKRFVPQDLKVQRNSYKCKALRLQKKQGNINSRKSTKKIMKRQRSLHKKKEIASFLQLK